MRSTNLGAIPMAVVLLMLAAAFMPTAGAQFPDLVLVTDDVEVGPQPLVVGVPATVSYNVFNYGMQNAYGFNVSLFDHGVEVASKRWSDCAIGENRSGSLPWVPEVPGTYNLTLKAWYGPTSSKKDENWDDNNHTFQVTVLTRPDVYLTDMDLSFQAPNPEYVVDGDGVTVDAFVHNAGTSPVAECNVSLWEGELEGEGTLIATVPAVTIPALGQSQVSIPWNTSGFYGKRTLFVHVTDVLPEEVETENNWATMPIKVHTKEDRVFDVTPPPIVSKFKVQFFITIEGSANLVVEESGNVSIFQDFDDQYDVEIMDSGVLTIDGGLLSSEFNYTVFLYDESKLVLRNGAEASLKIMASGSSEVELVDSTLLSPELSMSGGRLLLTNSTIEAEDLSLAHTELVAEGSTILAEETMFIDGRSAHIVDSEVRVVRPFLGWGPALGTYPQLEFADPETHQVHLPPALSAINGATVDLFNVSVESKVHITSENTFFWTANRLGALGLSSIIKVNRYLDVQVRDWSDQPVPGAKVEVRDYFDDIVEANGTTDAMGDLRLSVLTDYITPAQKPFVGNLRIRASAYGRTSDDFWFSHSKYPSMDLEDNVMSVRIEMPPNPSPQPGPEDKVWYVRTPRTISSGESSMDKNIIVDNSVLTLLNTTFTLEQESDFQWYIKVRGDNGVLRLVNSSLDSAFPFKIYLEDGATLNLTSGSKMENDRVRIIAEDRSTLQVVARSRVEGRIYTQCSAVEVVNSQLLLAHTRIKANTVSISGGWVHERTDMVIDANRVTLDGGLELSADYETAPSLQAPDLRYVVRYFGWSPFNDISYLTNITHGYFSSFAEESNITINAHSTLRMSNALVYAVDVIIEVDARSDKDDQAVIRDSWVGGIDLQLVSDDLEAYDTSFNRVLDDFTGEAYIRLESVEVPGVVCTGGAVAERYWKLTVNAMDGAGSIISYALLEVFSTETHERLIPKAGEENHPASRTSAAGRITVPILANHTDSTGDYFVGSVYFHLKFDGFQFANDPIYTETVQLNVKSDVTTGMRFSETITSPEKDLSYVVYTLTLSGESYDMRIFHHTFDTYEAAVAFVETAEGVEVEKWKGNWSMIRNTTVRMTFSARQLINSVWEPLRDGKVRLIITQAPTYNENQPAKAHNGSDLLWEVTPDEEGMGSQDIKLPDTLASFQLYIAISGGAYDRDFAAVDDKFWNFSVLPPQTIHVSSIELDPLRVEVGALVTVYGFVRYIYTNAGVEGAEIKITGTHISESQGRTNAEGRYSVQIQAPILVMNDLTLTVKATDTRTEEVAQKTISYDVVPPIEEREPDTFPWGWVIVGIIVAVLALAISFGAVMMYRRHYGEVVECGECGAFIPASSAACPKCGIEFETDLARCSECEAWIPANSNSCPVCGTAFTIESLEEQVAREEAEEEMAPIDQVTTTTAQLTPLTLESTTTEATKWGEREQKRRRRIKKRVKKRLTVSDAGDEEDEGAAPDEAKDLFVGEEDEAAARLPGLAVDESMLSDEEMSRLLPTEEMLKDLMLTTDQAPGEVAPEDLEAELAVEEPLEPGEPEVPAPEGEEPPEAPEGGIPTEELEEIPPPDEPLEEEELSIPEEEEAPEELEVPEEEPPEEGLPEEELPGEGELPEAEEPPGEMPPPDIPVEELPESRELLSELGLVAGAEDMEPEEEAPEEDSALSGLLAEKEDEDKEAPKLCPNCGGNWILYKDGEYTCRICGEKW